MASTSWCVEPSWRIRVRCEDGRHLYGLARWEPGFAGTPEWKGVVAETPELGAVMRALAGCKGENDRPVLIEFDPAVQVDMVLDLWVLLGEKLNLWTRSTVLCGVERED